MDIAEGENVDIVVAYPVYWSEIATESFQTVISGQMLEHCEYPWQAYREMGRILKTDGFLCVIAPRKAGTHRYPVDCWRFLPDGMRALGKWADLQTLETFVNGNDCVGIYKK